MNNEASLLTPTDAHQVDLSVPAPGPSSPPERQERLAAWLQLPRRIVLLLISFGLAWAVIMVLRSRLTAIIVGPLGKEALPNWSFSLTYKRPVAEIISGALPNTLLLLGAALLLALILALIAVLVALLAHALEGKAGPVGSILKGLGRLVIFSQAAMPALGMAMLLMIVFAVNLKWVPVAPKLTPGSPHYLADLLKTIISPTLALALLPATLAAQAVAREVTLRRERGRARLWLAGLFKGLGVLLGQVGAILSGTLVVESIFAWPGLGRLALTTVSNRDYPVQLGVIGAWAGLVLAGRLAAELFRWLERLVLLPISRTQSDPLQWRKTARKIWVIMALVLLLAPLALGVIGLTVNSDRVLQINSGQSFKPPSASHPWGTDSLGRDIQARALRGGLVTLGIAAFVSVIAVLPSLLGGALTGFLSARRTLAMESIADLLLLPADVLLFIPALLGAIVMMELMREHGLTWTSVGIAVAVVVLPRAVRSCQALWVTASDQLKGLALRLVSIAALFLDVLFVAFTLVTMLDFIGLGTPPPDPSLGSLVLLGMSGLRVRPEQLIISISLIWACAFAFYTAADALVGFFHSKEPLARLNE